MVKKTGDAGPPLLVKIAPDLDPGQLDPAFDEVGVEEMLAAGLSKEEAAATSPLHGAGCSACSDTGFKGRIAVYEVMVMTEELKEFVLNGASVR